MTFHSRIRAAGVVLATLSTSVGAQDTPTLPQVVVTARVDSASAFDLPASLDVVELGDGSARPQVNLSEALGGVPGLLARDRQNHAQDAQLSIRGFGARATFGVRGVRLYADGIPATMPDGQGQLSHFALAAGDRIEVMRGPFSALYGNSSGGVVQLWSADGSDPTRVDLRATAAEIARVSAAAKDGSAKRDELAGSTITITSLGPLGAIATTPILNIPEVAIIGVNRLAVRPFWNGASFEPRKMMNLSCSFDHRVIDGWDAAVFVARLRELLETPALIFVEG